ncbi:hypothetical protein [Paraferrimonas sedimenticola]|uniref:Uncharacterized protein n=1 Tax=Paraferrimonas sedimenticola TaxID=375674 RepID=A0AA37RZV4_9GAMM|nr:hypothetical protein [Paraferrimonas sedimenticola]GLP98129.1 hypothetical protein GCM10007895_34360 [Paraferrimonas sedimenticola]
MTNFQQVHQVLKRHQDLHLSLSRKYSELHDSSEDGRDGMLFQLLSEHQLRLANAIKEYSAQASIGVLNTFFQYTEDPSKAEAIMAFQQSNTLDSALVESMTMALDKQLHDIYEELREHAEVASVQELFANLRDHLEQQKIRLATDLATIPDV